MNVVVNAARRQKFDFIFPRNAANILKKSWLKFGRNHRTTFFGAENAMMKRIVE